MDKLGEKIFLGARMKLEIAIGRVQTIGGILCRDFGWNKRCKSSDLLDI